MKNLFSLLLIVGLFFTSCSSDSSDDVPQEEQAKVEIVGTWEATDECISDTCYGIGVTYDFLKFNNDGTITEGRDSTNNEIILTYTLDGDKLKLMEKQSDGSVYTTFNRVLTINENEFVFEEYADDNGEHFDIERYYFARQ